MKRLLLIICLCLLSATSAHAKRGLAIINTGDELFEVAPFPQDVIQEFPRATGYKAGYKCSHFGLFWADIWTWDCKLVAVTGENSYADLPEPVASKLNGRPEFHISHAQRGFWNHYAFWIAVAGLAGFVLLPLFTGSGKRRQGVTEA